MASAHEKKGALRERHIHIFNLFAQSFPASKWHRHECIVWDKFGTHSDSVTLRKQFATVIATVQRLDHLAQHHGISIIKHGTTMSCASASLNSSDAESFKPRYLSKVS